MQRREWLVRVEDILAAIQKISRYTRGMDFGAFFSDEKTVDAVLSNVIVIGEAANHIPAEIRQKYPEAPWTEMTGIRNIIVHEYFGVSLKILWETVSNDLPPLIPVLHAIIEKEKFQE
jgi:uncharacterized protein with HEPN domain